MTHEHITEPIFVQGDHRPRPRWTPPAMTSVDFTSAAHAELPPVRTWIVTFEEVFRASVHPTALPNARRCHPDGFVAIRSRAVDPDDVRSIAGTLFHGHLSGVREFCPADSARFALGCLATYDATARRWVGGVL